AQQTLFLTDPAGNHYAVYAPQSHVAVSSTASGRMTGVGYLELEAPDVAASVDFYEKVLGFEVQSRSEAPQRQATMRMASGQTLILTQASFSPKGLVMSRKVPGPHIAFYVPAANWSTAIAHLDALGISHGDRGAAKERHEGQGGTYMDDPAGYVIQFITDGME
ncbi:MAG TPA: VOC family protein, partial [Candidatus Acidoferrum sp.]|nr:VOC family protein [Candidatus Acidoferrum sp.]